MNNVVNFRASPQNRRFKETSFWEKIIVGIFGFFIISGVVGTIINSFIQILNGEILKGVAGLIPIIFSFLLLIALLSLAMGGEQGLEYEK